MPGAGQVFWAGNFQPAGDVFLDIDIVVFDSGKQVEAAFVALFSD